MGWQSTPYHYCLSLSIETDFALRETPVILVSGFSDVRLDASNDDVTLEIW